MKKSREFVADPQAFIAELLERGIAAHSCTELQTHQECVSGSDDWDDVQVKVTIVEWDEPDANTRPCNCGSGDSWVDCQARSSWCG